MKTTTDKLRQKAALTPRALTFTAGFALAAAALLTPSTLKASSHSDAPLIKQDPQANLTDLYAFVAKRPSGEKVLVVEVNVHPFCEPGDGLMFDSFSKDARYSIHITNPTSGEEVQRYDFRFSDVTAAGNGYKNVDTILRYGRGAEIGPIQTVGDARQNFTQSYKVTKTVAMNPPCDSTKLDGAEKLLVAPPNVGNNVTPRYNDASGVPISGATKRADLDPYTLQTTYDLPGGTTVFCGSRDDTFFADIPGIADLLNSRILDNNGTLNDGLGQDGHGVDGFKGYNVLHYAIMIPLTQLPEFNYTGALQPVGKGVGVYASVSRQSITIRNVTGPDTASGAWVQVNRLGNPLFNEALVAMVDKDTYNRTSPTSDATLFAKYARSPELAVLINATYATTFATNNRVDLVGIFIPDVLRVNTTTEAVRTFGDAGFKRLSFIAGDTIANNTGDQIPSGWPNGRRFGDDVVDIAFTALASGPTYQTITRVGDNVNRNDIPYNETFPYAGTPHSGTNNHKDSN